MGFFKSLFEVVRVVGEANLNDRISNLRSSRAIKGGKQKKDGSHKHSSSSKPDWTPARKANPPGRKKKL